MNPLFSKRAKEDTQTVLLNKLAQTSLLLEVLAQVNLIMSRGKRFEDFCIEVRNIIRGKLNFKFIYIWICDEKDPTLLRLLTPETAGGFRTMSVNYGIVGRAIREKRTVSVYDVSKDHDYINVHPETKSELCVPLICDERVIGAINIETDTNQTFEGHIPILEVIAENLSRSVKLALLYQTEEQFHRLVEHMSEGVWVGDSEEKTLYCNPAYEKIVGYTLEEMLQKTTFDVYDKQSCEIIRRENEKRKSGISSHYEATLIAKNGEHIPVLIHGVPFGKGTMAAITDLRAIRVAESKLMRAERFLASITQHCIEAIVGLNEEGLVQSWNIGAERMFGYKTDEIVGQRIDLITPEDRIAADELNQLIQETKTKGAVRNFETVRIHKNGKPINISLTLTAIRDDGGNLIGLSALYRDITAQKKWERELQDRFEKMQEAYREMGRQRRYIDYMIDMVNMAASSSMTLKQIAIFIANAMVMIARVDAVTLRLLDVSSGKLMLIAQSGLGEEWWSKKTIVYNGSLLEMAVKKGHPIKILDILNDSNYTSPALARKNGLRSALVIPLEAKGEVLGSLTLYLSQEGNLSLLDDEFIMMFARQAAIALKLASV